MKRVALGFGLIFLILLIPGVPAMDGPIANISETVTAGYNAVGTYSTSPSRTGSVTVAVPNTNDVLQYIRFNITMYDGANPSTKTNLLNNISYRDTAWGSDYTIFVNTSAADPDTSYTINNTNYGPALNLSMNITNHAGGEEFYDADNIRGRKSVNLMNVTISLTNPSTTLNLAGVTLRVQFNSSANDPSANDSLAMATYPIALIDGAASGTVIPDDLDGDNMNDTVNWTGTLNAGKSLIILFNATIVEGTNVPSGSSTQNFNNATSDVIGIGNTLGARAEFSNTSGTLTGLYFLYKFTRGPIRQGIDMFQNSTSHWNIRGFFDNPASSILKYNVTNWSVYNVTPSTGQPDEVRKEMSGGSDWSTGTIDAGAARKYTDWLYTGSTTKPFYASRFDWHVEWDSAQPVNYSGTINTTLTHLTLNRLDLTITHQAITGTVEPETANQNTTLKQDVAMAGSTSVRGGYVEIVATIPNESNDGDGYYFVVNASSPTVYYGNSTGGGYALEGANSLIPATNYTATMVSPTQYANGSVNITINDMDACYLSGHPNPIEDLDQSRTDQIRLRVVAFTPGNISVAKNFTFGGNATVISRTGTPITENVNVLRSIAAGGTRLLSYKQLWIEHTAKPTIVNASLVVSATGGVIDGIEVLDYVPTGTDFSMNNVTVRYQYANGSWVTLTNASATDTYLLNSKSSVTLPDGLTAQPWNYSANGTATTPWNGTLHANENLEINYTMNTTAGTYVLPSTMAGFDPVTGARIGSSTQAIITVVVPEPVAPLQITEGDLEQAKAVVVGKPALWVKSVEVYNPNSRPMESRFEIMTFGDTGEAYASYYNERGEKVEEAVALETINKERYLVWNTRMGAMETRTYEIRVLTPPVLEVDRDVEVLEKLEGKKVRIKMDIYLKSFAEEAYQNVKLNLPIPYEKVERVADAFGNAMAFTGGVASTTVMIPEMEAEGIKTVTIIYRESYPVIIVTPDRDRYELNSPVNLVILVINGGEKVNYPYLETEVYTPQMDLVYSSIQDLEGMEPLEKTEMTEKFVIPAVAPEGTYLANARFREDFTVIASGAGNFYVAGAFAGGAQAVEAAIILMVVLILIYFSYRRIREIRGIPKI